ncbi:MAG: hypothetical protein IPI00_17695 [Flavobacteriales bacterium]|nr:hypothetical protein [Flavobacteriales bacterium]
MRRTIKHWKKRKKAGEKAKKAVLSLNADISKLKSEVTGLESKFGITKDPKDLKPLTKARGKLSKKEGQLAKAMKSENKAYEDVSKYSGKSPDRAKEEAERAETMNAKSAIVDSLKKKMEMITIRSITNFRKDPDDHRGLFFSALPVAMHSVRSQRQRATRTISA